MTVREPTPWRPTVSRRSALLMAVAAATAAAAAAAVVAVAAADRQLDEAPESLNAACQDNQSRAYEAAERARSESTTDAAAMTAAQKYVKEVRVTPECFTAQVRADAEAVDDAIKGGGRPRPEYPKYIQ